MGIKVQLVAGAGDASGATVVRQERIFHASDTFAGQKNEGRYYFILGAACQSKKLAALVGIAC